MTSSRAKVAGRALDAAIAVCVMIAAAALVAAVALPATGHRLLVIRSGSMASSLPVGAAVLLEPVGPGGPAVGDVVSIRLPAGMLITHRVTRVADIDGHRYLATQGDANENEDPTAIPTTAVVGRVVASAPGLGFALAYAQSPIGRVALVLLFVALLGLRWLVDEEPDPAPVPLRHGALPLEPEPISVLG